MDPPIREMRFQVRSLYHELGVALMARTFSDNDSGRAQTKETTGGSADDVRVRVYRTWQVLHQIWLEENPPARHIQTEQPQPVHEQRLNLFGVFGCIQNRYK